MAYGEVECRFVHPNGDIETCWFDLDDADRMVAQGWRRTSNVRTDRIKPQPDTGTVDEPDLSELGRDALVDIAEAAGLDVPARATKAALVEMIEGT